MLVYRQRKKDEKEKRKIQQTSNVYPLANEVAKGYSNAIVRPSFRNILVNTLESTSFNGF
jgi:hypothetical protein